MNVRSAKRGRIRKHSMTRTSKTLACITFFLSLGTPLNGNAQGICKPHRPSTSLANKIESTKYVRSLNTEELTRLHSRAGNNLVMGLAGGEVGTRFQAYFDVKPISGNLYCLNLERIKATLYAKPKVHIAKNFRRGTCEYNAVLRHEEKHVAALKRTHSQYLPGYRKHLRLTSMKVPVLPPMTLAEANEKKNILIKRIGEDLRSYLEIIMKDVADRQAEIDSSEEYQSVWNKCDRWEKRLNDQ